MEEPDGRNAMKYFILLGTTNVHPKFFFFSDPDPDLDPGSDPDCS